jgi:hypothetical protein
VEVFWPLPIAAFLLCLVLGFVFSRFERREPSETVDDVEVKIHFPEWLRRRRAALRVDPAQSRWLNLRARRLCSSPASNQMIFFLPASAASLSSWWIWPPRGEILFQFP